MICIVSPKNQGIKIKKKLDAIIRGGTETWSESMLQRKDKPEFQVSLVFTMKHDDLLCKVSLHSYFLN